MTPHAHLPWVCRRCVLGMLLACLMLATAQANSAERGRTALAVPGCWEEVSGGRFADYDGIAWHRAFVRVPAGWAGQELGLAVEQVDNACEVYVNGERVGAAGSFPPNYASGLHMAARHRVPTELVKFGELNVVAIRVYDAEGRGGFKGAAPALVCATEAVVLAGNWQFRAGDDAAWAVGEPPADGTAVFEQVTDAAAVAATMPGRLAPAAEAATFRVAEDLEVELVLAEPEVRQPVFMTFDERGRLWVVQYLQYPFPAGLKILSEDRYLRATYDKVPPPPPHHYRGADRVSIHEDTDGDGRFDRHKTFLEGLNIVTAVQPGRGGVWVLNPPYLLFYPDADRDDVPDADPEVHLAGFGLEDTHSNVSCLTWGPDGWLYAAQGSTVSGQVVRPGMDRTPVSSMGQLIWRYHAEERRYEIFAEGGGNAWGVEIDAAGRLFSGHNGGDTRGFHYVQGGYYQKGFGKHGPLSNPYTFGYFTAMPHPSVPRFTHTFVIYDGVGLPARYHGRLFGVAPLLNHVVCARLERLGSSFRTEDEGYALEAGDRWFRPVDIKAGPDGALYVADMYEGEIAHLRHHEGKIDKTSGRIWRIKARGGGPAPRVGDLGALSTPELAALLAHPNKWHRRTALRLLGDRRDASANGHLRQQLLESRGQLALESLWALHLSGGFTEEAAQEALAHAEPLVRAWAVRLLGDAGCVTAELAARLAELAAVEPAVEVRSQLASTARRLPAEQGLPIVRRLLEHDEDAGDVHLPLLLWWAIEARCGEDRERVLAMFADAGLWERRLVVEHICPRLMRRFAATGRRQDLAMCGRLVELAPHEEAVRVLVRGFEEAMAGRRLPEMPASLARAIERLGGQSPLLALRQGDAEAIALAMKTIADPQADVQQRLQYVQVFGEIRQSACIPVLLGLLSQAADDALRGAALSALAAYDEPEIAQRVLGLLPSFPDELRASGLLLLASRQAWALRLVEAIEAGAIDPAAVPLDVVRLLTAHREPRIAEPVARIWGQVEGASTAEMQEELVRCRQAVLSGKGDPYSGKRLFAAACAKCHRLFGEGGDVGPDLTAYKRDDVENLLLHVVHPSAEIREGFGTWQALTGGGRLLAGLLIERDEQAVVLRTSDGQNVTLLMEDLEELIPQQKSLMPEGLTRSLSDQQVRDLAAYLRSTQPLPE
ncbi:MAG: c-type cytochrome [Pirellulales bacterium]|nr:c-type cytochrome [Pirellulales bacterium]